MVCFWTCYGKSSGHNVLLTIWTQLHRSLYPVLSCGACCFLHWWIFSLRTCCIPQVSAFPFQIRSFYLFPFSFLFRPIYLHASAVHYQFSILTTALSMLLSVFVLTMNPLSGAEQTPSLFHSLTHRQAHHGHYLIGPTEARAIVGCVSHGNSHFISLVS